MTSDYLLLIAQFIGLNTVLNYEFLILMLQKFQIRNCSFYLSAPSDTKSPEMCMLINPYPTAFPYGNGMVLHFYQQQESSTTKTVHKVINKGLKTYV